MAPGGRACGERHATRTGQLRAEREAGAGSAGEEGAGTRVASRQSGTRRNQSPRVWTSPLRIQAPAARSPLAGHLLPLPLVPAHFGGVQLLRARGGGCPHSRPQGPSEVQEKPPRRTPCPRRGPQHPRPKCALSGAGPRCHTGCSPTRESWDSGRPGVCRLQGTPPGGRSRGHS